MDQETLMHALTVDQLRKQADSLIESVGAFQFSLARIAQLEGYRERLETILRECQEVLAPTGNTGLVARIATILREHTDDVTL